jgi:hypothetical protein
MLKQLEIQIAPDDLEFLKSNQYMLCFAMMTQGDNEVNNTSIVWQCFDDYLQNNPFSWFPEYQVFGSSAYNVGDVATVDTTPLTIALGQRTTLNADASFGPFVALGVPNMFAIANEYRQQIHLGFGSASTGPDGVQRITPVFVTPNPIGPNIIYSFMPVDTVRVWFQQNVVTSTIVGPGIPNAIEIDLRTRDFGKLRYQDGKWSEQGGPWSNTL